MGTVSDVLHRLGAHGAAAQSLRVAIYARSFFDDVSAPGGEAGCPYLCPSCAYTRSSKAGGSQLPSTWAGETSPRADAGVPLRHLGRAGPSGRQRALGPFSTRLNKQHLPLSSPAVPGWSG